MWPPSTSTCTNGSPCRSCAYSALVIASEGTAPFCDSTSASRTEVSFSMPFTQSASAVGRSRLEPGSRHGTPVSAVNEEREAGVHGEHQRHAEHDAGVDGVADFGAG